MRCKEERLDVQRRTKQLNEVLCQVFNKQDSAVKIIILGAIVMQERLEFANIEMLLRRGVGVNRELETGNSIAFSH